MLLASLVLRVMTISSGVTRRKPASARRASSFPVVILARFSNDGSPSMSFVLRYIASRTGAGDGHRFAAFITARSAGIRNCSRTDNQKRSSGCAGVCANGAGQASSCCGSNIAPLKARKREKSRRLMCMEQPPLYSVGWSNPTAVHAGGNGKDALRTTRHMLALMVSTHTQNISTKGQGDAHDLTQIVAKAVARSNIASGVATVF